MHQFNCMNIRKKALLTFFTLVFIAIFAIGGCNNNNNGGDPDPDNSACGVETSPCTSVMRVTESGVTYGECFLDISNCAADLSDVVNQINANGINVTNSSTFWIGLWGGSGGGALENGGSGGAGGYAQFTSTVSDFESAHSGVSTIYYILGDAGGVGNNHCGGGGGASSIVTLEDMTLNPTVSPDANLLLMIAGGGGGGGGGTQKGCSIGDGDDGSNGGVAIAGTNSNISGAGDGCQNGSNCNSKNSDSCGSSICGASGEGGGTSGDSGGIRQCCSNAHRNPTNGMAGLGGIGGTGGPGKNCSTGGSAGHYRNAFLSFSAGEGGNGGGGGSDCISGGGGGGGGYGGGGGGGLGGDFVDTQSGGGGGSFSVESTKTASIAPTSRPANPCGVQGCIVINVIED